MLVTQPVRYRFGPQPWHMRMLVLEPLGEGFRLGADAGFSLPSMPPRTVFRLNQMHRTGPSRCARVVNLQRLLHRDLANAKRPAARHVGLENHQLRPFSAMPRLQDIIPAFLPM